MFQLRSSTRPYAPLPMTRSTGGGAVTRLPSSAAGGDGEHPRHGRVTSRSTFTRGSGKKVLGYVITSVVVGQMVVAVAAVPSFTPPPPLPSLPPPNDVAAEVTTNPLVSSSFYLSFFFPDYVPTCSSVCEQRAPCRLARRQPTE